jgi:hypothetical protein
VKLGVYLSHPALYEKCSNTDDIFCHAAERYNQHGNAAMENYRRLHQQYPTREFYFVHTNREELDIRERRWLGIRRNNAVITEV